MLAHSTAQATAGPPEDNSQARGRSGRFLPGHSGNPLGARGVSKRFAELASDFGGVERLSPTDATLLRLACRLLTRAERAGDDDAAVRAASEARRILAAIRKSAGAAPGQPQHTLADHVARLRQRQPAVGDS